MNKKTFLIRTFVLAALVLFVYYGIHYADLNKPLTSANECNFTVSACTLTLDNKTIGLSFVHPPVTEEELFIIFSIPDGLHLEKVWIEGTDMYMGKTPVMFEDPNNPYLGVTFLGSCNLAEMKWALHIEIGKSGLSNNASVEDDADNVILSASFLTHSR